MYLHFGWQRICRIVQVAGENSDGCTVGVVHRDPQAFITESRHVSTIDLFLARKGDAVQGLTLIGERAISRLSICGITSAREGVNPFRSIPRHPGFLWRPVPQVMILANHSPVFGIPHGSRLGFLLATRGIRIRRARIRTRFTCEYMLSQRTNAE